MTDPDRPKSILYVITKGTWGGAQRYVYDLAKAATQKGFAVALAYGEEGLLVERFRELGGVIAIPGLARDLNPKAELQAFKELAALFRREMPDVVHVNSSKGGLAVLAARSVHVPNVIFTAHGFAFNEKRSFFQKLLIRLAYAATVYLSHTTICVSEAIRRDLRYLPFTGRKLVVVRHGADASSLLPRAQARATLAPDLSSPIWLGMVAELHPSKRVEDAIDALALLTETHPEAALVVIGEGELRGELEERIRRRGLEGSVRLCGFVEDSYRYLQAFDVFLMLSRTEALGYALLEAGHASLPAVGTRVGGIPEIIQHKKTGFLVPPENPAAVARLLRTLLDEPQTSKELGEKLHAHVQSAFSTERMLEETLALY